jgi:hypothetical protein
MVLKAVLHDLTGFTSIITKGGLDGLSVAALTAAHNAHYAAWNGTPMEQSLLPYTVPNIEYKLELFITTPSPAAFAAVMVEFDENKSEFIASTRGSALFSVIDLANAAWELAGVVKQAAVDGNTPNKDDIVAAYNTLTAKITAINAPATTSGSYLNAATLTSKAINLINKVENELDATGNLIMTIPKSGDTAADSKFTVTVANAALMPLVHAHDGGSGAIATLFATNEVLLAESSTTQRSFPAPSAAGTLTYSTDVVTTTFEIANSLMPNEDAYGVLNFDSTYYPFGVRTFPVWHIRNGLNNTKLDFDEAGTSIASVPSGSDTVGGGIFVTIGWGGSDLIVDLLVTTD